MDTRLPSGAPAAVAGTDAIADRTRALQRLMASRQRLQATWLPAPSAGVGADRGGGLSRKARALWRSWRRRLDPVPGLGVLLQAVEQSWQRHPLRVAGQALSGELQGAVTPWVRRHPLLTVALAAATGAMLVAARPWVWPLVATRARLLPRRVGHWLLHQVTQVPLQSLLSTLVLVLGAQAARAAAPQSPSPAPAQAHEPPPAQEAP